MRVITSFQFTLINLLLLICCSSTSSVETVRCMPSERKALLNFKAGLIDPSNRLSSWYGDDCCRWEGVSCNNITGQVKRLDLYNPFPDTKQQALSGNLNASLVELRDLEYLDLSYNYFDGVHIPTFIGSLKELRYLDLSSACFSGTIPPHLGNLSNMHHLGLRQDRYLPCTLELKADNLQWLSSLNSLKFLDLSKLNLSNFNNWLHSLNMHPSLSELHLSSCNLSYFPPISSINMTSLQLLDLNGNNFHGHFPPAFLNLTFLTHIDLGGNYLEGPMPDTFAEMVNLKVLNLNYDERIQVPMPTRFGRLCKLEELHLTGNKIRGEISEMLTSLFPCAVNSLQSLDLARNEISGCLPDSLGHFQNLTMLSLYNNKMNGTFPESLWQLTKLVVLHLENNFWEGSLSAAHHFGNLKNLEVLTIASTSSKSSLIINVSSNWIPPFTSLYYIDFSYWQLGPLFPTWLQYLKNLKIVVLSNVGISDIIPDWFENFTLQLAVLDLSNNQIRGKLPISLLHIKNINLASNHSQEFTQLLLPSNMRILSLGNNSFSGSIPSEIDKMVPNLEYLDVSKNLLDGKISSSICGLATLRVLFLSSNHLSGELPQRCWNIFQQLEIIDLSNNNLFGKIPSSVGSLHSLTFFKLSNNKFFGAVPSSMQNCKSLRGLDLGENYFSGKIPQWLGTSLLNLRLLRLRSNIFAGQIPRQLCSLSLLQGLDLGHNILFGSIPSCFEKLSGMVESGSTSNFDVKPNFHPLTMMVTKGQEREYSSALDFMKYIDLSCNNLRGKIPAELTKLMGLRILNLSFNQLTGTIPKMIGLVHALEVLDLSRNQLSGPIPSSMSSLTSLNQLNLSFNNLSGRIPSGQQLQTLINPSIYEGNLELCGPPLIKECEGDRETSQGLPPVSNNDKEADKHEIPYLWISIVLGFIVGFWSVCGTLLLMKSWRYAYFQFLSDMKDKIIVFIELKKVSFRRKLLSEEEASRAQSIKA